MNDLEKKELVNMWLSQHLIKGSSVKKIEITPVSEEKMSEIDDLLELKACFNNSFNCVTSGYFEDASYVLCVGLMFETIPFEHAIIKVGDKYYDPTLQKYSKDGERELYAITEFDASELYDFADATEQSMGNAYPPDLYKIRKMNYIPSMILSREDALMTKNNHLNLNNDPSFEM